MLGGCVWYVCSYVKKKAPLQCLCSSYVISLCDFAYYVFGQEPAVAMHLALWYVVLFCHHYDVCENSVGSVSVGGYGGLSKSGLCVFCKLCPVCFLVVGKGPSVVNVYLDHLKFCVVCINNRKYVCCSECDVVSNECNEPTSCLVQPIGAHCCEVMYFGCFGFRGELGFLNCDDVCMCVVNKQFELLEFVSESVYVDLQYDEISLTFTAGSVCLCGVNSPVVVLGLFVRLS